MKSETENYGLTPEQLKNEDTINEARVKAQDEEAESSIDWEAVKLEEAKFYEDCLVFEEEHLKQHEEEINAWIKANEE